MNKPSSTRSFVPTPTHKVGQYPGDVGALFDSIRHQGAVRVLGFGRYYKDEDGQDWTFRHYKTPADAKVDSSISRFLPEIAAKIGVKELLVPTPVFGTDVATASKLSTHIALGSSSTILRRGFSADIIDLTPGETFAISLGGCAVLYAYYPHTISPSLVVGHAARKNLDTVVQKMWEVLRVPSFNLDRVQVGVCFPIDPRNFEHTFDDPDFGLKNQTLCEQLVGQWGEESVFEWNSGEKRRLGRIDMGWVLRQQFIKLGVPPKNVHGTPLFDYYPGHDGEPLWHTTRGPADKRDRRNLVIVSHRYMSERHS